MAGAGASTGAASTASPPPTTIADNTAVPATPSAGAKTNEKKSPAAPVDAPPAKADEENSSRGVKKSEIPRDVTDVYYENPSRFREWMPKLTLSTVRTDLNGIQGPAIGDKESLAQYQASVFASTNSAMQRAYDISSQTGQASFDKLQYGAPYRNTPNQFFNAKLGQCDDFGSYEFVSFVNDKVSTYKNTWVWIQAFSGGFFHTGSMFRLSDHSNWVVDAYSRLITVPTLSLTGASQGWFGSSELTMFGKVDGGNDGHIRVNFIMPQPSPRGDERPFVRRYRAVGES